MAQKKQSTNPRTIIEGIFGHSMAEMLFRKVTDNPLALEALGEISAVRNMETAIAEQRQRLLADCPQYIDCEHLEASLGLIIDEMMDISQRVGWAGKAVSEIEQIVGDKDVAHKIAKQAGRELKNRMIALQSAQFPAWLEQAKTTASEQARRDSTRD